MTLADVQGLLPLVVVAATAVVVLLEISVRRPTPAAAPTAAAGILLALLSLPLAARVAPRSITELAMADGYALVFVGLVLCAALLVVALAYSWLSHEKDPREELFVLVLLATLGAGVMAYARHMASLFLGLETLSISLYGMIAYPRTRERSLEAGVKYLVLAGASSGFLLFGIALLYAQTGSLDMVAMLRALEPASASALGLCGLALILAGLAFKLALVPFHLWTPDVYEGAPAPVTAFVATVSKGAVVAVVLRLLSGLRSSPRADSAAGLYFGLALLAGASMVAGNLLALRQRNVKRLLAYSSIAHLGYVLVAMLAGGSEAVVAVSLYLAAYFASILGAFAVVEALGEPTGDGEGTREAETIDDYRGLFWRRPRLAAAFTICVFSLAGIPLTAGFMGKLYAVSVGLDSSLWTLVVLLAVTSAIGLYYYLRLVVMMFANTERAPADRRATAPFAGIVLAVATLVVLWIGLVPAPFVGLFHSAATALF